MLAYLVCKLVHTCYLKYLLLLCWKPDINSAVYRYRKLEFSLTSDCRLFTKTVLNFLRIRVISGKQILWLHFNTGLIFERFGQNSISGKLQNSIWKCKNSILKPLQLNFKACKTEKISNSAQVTKRKFKFLNNYVVICRKLF